MKAYKTFDLFSQMALVLILIAGYLSGAESMSPFSFIIGLGLLQVISLVVHFSKGTVVWKASRLRKWHLITTGLVFLLILVAFVQDAFRSGDKYDMAGLGTMIWAGVLALAVMLFYTAITWLEWWRMRNAK